MTSTVDSYEQALQAVFWKGHREVAVRVARHGIRERIVYGLFTAMSIQVGIRPRCRSLLPEPTTVS